MKAGRCVYLWLEASFAVGSTGNAGMSFKLSSCRRRYVGGVTKLVSFQDGEPVWVSGNPTSSSDVSSGLSRGDVASIAQLGLLFRGFNGTLHFFRSFSEMMARTPWPVLVSPESSGNNGGRPLESGCWPVMDCKCSFRKDWCIAPLLNGDIIWRLVDWAGFLWRSDTICIVWWVGIYWEINWRLDKMQVQVEALLFFMA